jgi:hypothetical protein
VITELIPDRDPFPVPTRQLAGDVADAAWRRQGNHGSLLDGQRLPKKKEGKGSVRGWARVCELRVHSFPPWMDSLLAPMNGNSPRIYMYGSLVRLPNWAGNLLRLAMWRLLAPASPSRHILASPAAPSHGVWSHGVVTAKFAPAVHARFG